MRNLLFFGVILSMSSALFAADPYHWEAAGPGGGGRYNLPALSTDGSRMLSASDMGNSFAGNTADKKMFMTPQKYHSFTASGGFIFNPNKPGEVYTSSTVRGPRKSSDYGRTWVELELPIDKIEWNGSWPPPYSGPMLGAFDGPNGFLACYNFGTKGRHPVFYSGDGGVSWKPVALLPEESGNLKGVISFGNNMILIAQEDAIRKVGADGTVETVYTPVEGKIAGLAVDRKALLLAVNRKDKAEILSSTDGGKNWNSVKALGSKTAFRYIKSGGGKNPAVYFVMTSPVKASLTEPGEATVYKTTDGFKTHQPVLFRHPDSPKFNVENRQWTATAWGWQKIPQGLDVADGNADYAMCTDYTQIYLTTNGGKSWTALAAPSADNGESTLAVDSMPVMSAYDYYFDPNNRENRYIAMNDFSNWGSFDGGKSWKQYNEGNPFPHNVYSIVYDPKVPGKMWAGAAKDHDLPHWKWQNNNNKPTNQGGLIISDDSGKTWQPVPGCPAGTITGLVLIDSDTLLAAVYGKGIYKSTDGGKSWTESSEGISKWDRKLFRLKRDSHGRLWTIGTVQLPGMFYMSGNNGESWKKVYQDRTFGYLTEVALHPADPDTIYLSAFSTRPFHDTDGGIRKSVDGGKTWKTVFPGRACWGVYVNPADPNTVFAATYDAGVFRSIDGGETWVQLEDYPAPSPIRIVFDPEDSNTIYVCNYGASVYKGTLK